MHVDEGAGQVGQGPEAGVETNGDGLDVLAAAGEDVGDLVAAGLGAQPGGVAEQGEGDVAGCGSPCRGSSAVADGVAVQGILLGIGQSQAPDQIVHCVCPEQRRVQLDGLAVEEAEEFEHGEAVGDEEVLGERDAVGAAVAFTSRS